MKSLRDAITDYLSLRRSLGFKLRDMATGCRQRPGTFQRASTLDLSLFIRVVDSQWTAHQRGHQVGAQRCGS